MSRIVHTADWHLGARLVDCDRIDEHRAFLDWLLEQLVSLKPDILVVTGDIFENANPPQEAFALYYGFLARLAADVKCRVLILGGNHDSPATLHAPRELLHALRIRVVGSVPANVAGELLELDDAIICAVPYLRERDVRQAVPGETFGEVAAAIRTGIARHYRRLCAAATDLAKGRVLVATGHLTAAGSKSSPSERAIHIGNLGAIDAGCFDGFAYTALGHIHRPQCVGGNERIRYVGSPMPLSFAEVDCPKEIHVIDIAGERVEQSAIVVPVFRSLLRISSTGASFAADLTACEADASALFEPWIELTVTDSHSHTDLDAQVRDVARHLRLRVLKLIAAGADPTDVAHADPFIGCSLDDLVPSQVFVERLRRAQIDPDSDEGSELLGTFAELLSGMEDSPETDVEVNV